MGNDPEPKAEAPRKKPFSFAGVIAALLGIAELALYVVYVAQSSNGPAVNGPWLRLGLMVLFALSVLAGLYALCRRRWIGGLIGIICPALLPLFDWIVRMAR